MQSRGSGHRQLGLMVRSRISSVMLAMFATMASFYVAGRLWQDAENRVYLIKELDRRTGQAQSAISVDDTLKVVACRHQHKRLAALEMELAAAGHEGFVGSYSSETNGTNNRRRLMAVIGVITEFGRKNNRDAIRRSWLPTGPALKRLEEEKGVLVRFVIGRSTHRGDSFDREIDDENMHTEDFVILDNHIEASEERPKKTKLFFAHAADTWDAEFYAKVNDDVYVNIDALGVMLATHWDKPRVYMGCMKSGEVFSQSSHKWYEPDWWKFGDGKSNFGPPTSFFFADTNGRSHHSSARAAQRVRIQNIFQSPNLVCAKLTYSSVDLHKRATKYLRHASGEIFVISRALAQFISINRSFLRTYAHDDVSVGSWMIALDVKHINEGRFCCSSSWSSGAICTAV